MHQQHKTILQTQRNIPVSIDALANDSDVRGQPLSIILQVDPNKTKGFVEIQDCCIIYRDSMGECDVSEVSLEKEIENKIKSLKSEFKAQEKELKQQLKDLKKDKKSHDEDQNI